MTEFSSNIDNEDDEAKIVELIKKKFPSAVRVVVSVTHKEHDVQAQYKDVSGPDHGASYTCLDGHSAHRRSA